MTWASAEAAGQACRCRFQAAGETRRRRKDSARSSSPTPRVGADLLDIAEALPADRRTMLPQGDPDAADHRRRRPARLRQEFRARTVRSPPPRGSPRRRPRRPAARSSRRWRSFRSTPPGVAGDPGSAIAAAVFAALGRERSGVNYAALADEAAHAGVDPYQAANKALERHDEARRRLDAERQARDDVEARRARLIENMLYETAGSRIDAYARAKRGPIEARLAPFRSGRRRLLRQFQGSRPRSGGRRLERAGRRRAGRAMGLPQPAAVVAGGAGAYRAGVRTRRGADAAGAPTGCAASARRSPSSPTGSPPMPA